MTLLANRYMLTSPLGRGGMGQVWEAQDQRLGRRVAVKMLTGTAIASWANADDLVRRFARETTVTAGLRHPGVPVVYDAGPCDDGGLFLVLELVEGRTIGDVIAELGPLPVPWAAAIAGQVAAVLAAAHAGGLVHRDLKPQNIMITDDGTVKVLDFGLATLLDRTGLSRITRSGEVIGTPSYMAPEQLRGEAPAPQADLYALGCILYEMLTGQPPFRGPDATAVIYQHMEQLPAALGRSDVHPALEELVMQLLGKHSASRPASAQEVYDRLLPLVSRAEPLGDIDPSGHLSARVLARLGGHHVPGPMPLTPAMPLRSLSGAASRRTMAWRLTHSLWLLPALLGCGLLTWVSFFYLGARHRRRSWIAAAVAYLVSGFGAWAVLGSVPEESSFSFVNDIAFVMAVVVWMIGCGHAFWANETGHLRLLEQDAA